MVAFWSGSAVDIPDAGTKARDLGSLQGLQHTGAIVNLPAVLIVSW